MRHGLDRRQLVAAFGAAALTHFAADQAWAQAPAAITLSAKTASLAVGTATAGASALEPFFLGSFRRGDQLSVDLINELPAAVTPCWRIGAPERAALSALEAVPSRGRARVTLSLPQAGTQLLELREGDGSTLPLAAFAVAEPEIVVADREECLLIEEWPLATAGRPADGTSTAFLANRRLLANVPAVSGGVLRLRLVNASPRSIVALKVEDHTVTVIAIDGQPCERFPAREGQVMLAPGARMDVLVETAKAPESSASILLHDGRAARPIARIVYEKAALKRQTALHAGALPSNGLPDKIDLQRALRVTLAFDGRAGDWASAASLNPASFGPEAFRIKRGRAAVLTLTNTATAPAVFRLHGHHARLLDRLDDGWKPFWLDTITVAAGQTQRIAFVAATVGSFPIEAMLAQWNAPRLARRFSVEA